MKKLKLYLVLASLIVAAGGAFALVTNVVEAHTRTVKIKVNKNGFSPASIEVEAGHKLNLVFNREADNNCGDVVVFPSLKIRKRLPLKKDIIVSFTPSKTGEVTFTCGMGMYKGAIVVSD
jgi:plastocyanin domain-containing protein